MSLTFSAITYSLYKMDEGKFSVAITREDRIGELETCALLTYHRGVPLSKCLEVIENRHDEETRIPDDFDDPDVRFSTYMIDGYPIPAIQTLHNGKVFTATDLEMKGLTEEEITLLKELDRKENEGKN
jgi:hypothetical protein